MAVYCPGLVPRLPGQNPLIGVLDVLSGEGLAIVPLDTFLQIEGQAEAILAELPVLANKGTSSMSVVNLTKGSMMTLILS